MILETFIEMVNGSVVGHYTNSDSQVDLELTPRQGDFQHHDTDIDMDSDDEAVNSIYETPKVLRTKRNPAPVIERTDGKDSEVEVTKQVGKAKEKKAAVNKRNFSVCHLSVVIDNRLLIAKLPNIGSTIHR